MTRGIVLNAFKISRTTITNRTMAVSNRMEANNPTEVSNPMDINNPMEVSNPTAPLATALDQEDTLNRGVIPLSSIKDILEMLCSAALLGEQPLGGLGGTWLETTIVTRIKGMGYESDHDSANDTCFLS